MFFFEKKVVERSPVVNLKNESENASKSTIKMKCYDENSHIFQCLFANHQLYSEFSDFFLNKKYIRFILYFDDFIISTFRSILKQLLFTFGFSPCPCH